MARTKSVAGIKIKTRELRWPELGVVRRRDTEGRPDFQPPFPTPWAVNCRLIDPLEKRLRGGSRPGLTTWTGNLAGRTIGPALAAADLAKAPTGCTHGCWYRNRLVAGGLDHRVFFARQDAPADWGFGADVGDRKRPTIIQLSKAGEIGGTTTALLPFQDASMLAATADSLWLLQGDPAANGSLKNLSRGVGIVGPTAWCAIEDGRVGDTPIRFGFVFLSSLGLFLIGPSGDGLQSLSEERIPQELRNISATTTVSLAYSPDERGVYIFTTPASGTGTHWFFDLVHQGFWPMVFQVGHQPLAAGWLDGALVLDCKDETLRYVGGSSDGGTAIESYVLIGPLRLGGPETYGILTRIHAALPPNSASVGWRIIPGDTAAQACANGESAITAYMEDDLATADTYVSYSGAWQSGRSLMRYPRVRAMWVCILLLATSPWAYESIVIQSHETGYWR